MCYLNFMLKIEITGFFIVNLRKTCKYDKYRDIQCWTL